PVGYKVVFVAFRDGMPSGPPVDFVTGFLGEDGKTRGRPVGVVVDPKGALIVADDLSNTVWRVTRNASSLNSSNPSNPSSNDLNSVESQPNESQPNESQADDLQPDESTTIESP